MINLICKGSIENMENEKVGVVSVVFISYDADISKQKLQEFIKNDTESIYMLYCVPLDTDLATLEHYPSIAVTKKRFNVIYFLIKSCSKIDRYVIKWKRLY